MATPLDPNDAPSWTQWITDFDNTYAQFQANFSALTSPDMQAYITNSHPELLSTYNDLVARGQGHAKTLQELKATRDYVWSWLQWLNNGLQAGIDFVSSSAQSAYDSAKAFLGLSGVPKARIVRGLNGLGIAPMVVIGIAAAAAALVVIGYWIKDTYAFAQRVNALQAQESFLLQNNPSLTPEEAATQAASIVDNTLGPAPASVGMGGNLLGIPWTVLVAGAVAVFLGPPLIEAMSGRTRARY